MRNKYCDFSSVAAALLYFALMQTSVAGAESEKPRDDVAIRAQATEYARAFAVADTDSIMSMWDERAVLADQFGNIWRGKDAIRKQYSKFFETNGGRAIEIAIDDISFPADNVAVEEGRTSPSAAGSPENMSRYVAVHVKRNGKWLMESVSESPFVTSTNGEYLKPLAFFLGCWKVAGTDADLSLKIDWLNENVISCRSELSPKGGRMSSHAEFIYWNPQTHRINSFQLDSLGGIARKIWEPAGDGWIVHANSVQADGGLSSADYILKPADKDSFSWQSIRRNLSGVDLPDTEKLKLLRVKS